MRPRRLQQRRKRKTLRQQPKKITTKTRITQRKNPRKETRKDQKTQRRTRKPKTTTKKEMKRRPIPKRKHSLPTHTTKRCQLDVNTASQETEVSLEESEV